MYLLACLHMPKYSLGPDSDPYLDSDLNLNLDLDFNVDLEFGLCLDHDIKFDPHSGLLLSD